MKAMVVDDCLVMAMHVESSKHSLSEIAKMLAEMETTGGAGPGADDLMVRCTGRVLDVQEESPGVGTIQIGLPLENLNFDTAANAFTSIYLYMIGGASMAWLEYDKSRLTDFSLPDSALSVFPGPRFGPDGTRALLGADANELLVGTIVKPTAGLHPQQVAELCYSYARGGMRFIKDDEKMANPRYCPLEERVPAVIERIRQAEQETGQRCLYAPHISTGPQQILDWAHFAVEHGATALMINMFAAGFHSLLMVRQDPSLNVPIYGHCGGKEAMSRAEGQGVSMEVVAKFARLLGADYFRIGLPGGYLVGNKPEELRSLFAAMTEPWGPIGPMVPASSGGLKPANIGTGLELFGKDAMYLAGTGVSRHPLGVAAGVRAIKQAAEAFLAGIPIEGYAKTHEELRIGLEL
ncbi:MAG: hypothetical protein HPY90_07775 [Syntrophothermus sp.]|uniref:RuBisCO large subunit C-terminal-like domain-containing protein n=1 Tax=Syntrophothermus sp. TaxID=2736299 RepID=UPI00257C096A|nr:RuBisCO large subunit C-terminal-like domain-containing protein [Syntrophothermus sp.]NSW83159.1 hypothetical protein [Syntrophothermus sp.]